jgi:hypothetical protein
MARAPKRSRTDNVSAWRGLAILAGLALGALGFLTIESALKTAVIAYHAHNYRAVEFEILNVVPSKSGPGLRGRIVPEGSAAEAYTSEFEEVWTGTARSTVRHVKPEDELRGARLPAWHNPAVPGPFAEARVLSRSRQTTLPGTGEAVAAGSVPVITLAIAVVLVRWGASAPRASQKRRSPR